MEPPPIWSFTGTSKKQQPAGIETQLPKPHDGTATGGFLIQAPLLTSNQPAATKAVLHSSSNGRAKDHRALSISNCLKLPQALTLFALL